MSYSNETRTLRHRLNALTDRMDRARAGGDAFKSARTLVKVFQEATIPTQPDHYFACHPCTADGAEQESQAPTFNCDGSTTIYVDFLNRAPIVDDMAVATAVGGRWVAELGGGQSKVCIKACGGTPLVGALVQVLSGTTLVASCTTGADGCCQLPASGTYTLRITYAGQVVFSGTRALSGTVSVGASPSPGYLCCGTHPIPTTLTLTTALGTAAFVFNGAVHAWTASQVYSPGGDIVNDLCSFDSGRCQWAAFGPGSVRVDYYGYCTDILDPTHVTYPPGQFLVRARWDTVSYSQTPAFGGEAVACAAGNTPKVWYPSCCDSNPGSCTDNLCTYLDTASGKFNAFFPWNTSAAHVQAPASWAPFAWSGGLDPETIPAGCPTPPAMGVAISA